MQNTHYKFKLQDEDYKRKISSSFAEPHQKMHYNLVAKLGVTPGETVLDLGCGWGSSIPNLLRAVGIYGKVIGYDINENYLAIAERVFSEEIKARWLEFILGNKSDKLPFEDDCFDRILCHNVIECVPNKDIFINEIYRVLKPNGALVLSHYDFDTGIYNSNYKELTRELIHHYSDYTQDWQEVSDGQVGRKLRSFVAKSKFNDCSASTTVLTEDHYEEDSYGFKFSQWVIDIARKSGKFQEADLEKWIRDLKQKDKDNSYYFAICLMMIIARK